MNEYRATTGPAEHRGDGWDSSQPSYFLAATLNLFNQVWGEGQIMPRVYGCPNQFLDRSAVPVIMCVVMQVLMSTPHVKIVS